MAKMITKNRIVHNKKKNVGLIYEFICRYMAKALLESREEDVKKAKILFKKHFNNSTELYKELKLFRVLKETKVSNRDAAIRLIEKVKELAVTQNQSKLDLEKINLVNDINQTLKDPNFFKQNIEDHKLYSSIQILLNSWRGHKINENISAVFHFEELLIEHMLLPNNINNVTNLTSDHSNNGEEVNRLIVDIMINKINEKFDSLNEEQKRIITLYVLQQNNDEAKKELGFIFENLKSSINNFELSEENEEIKKKLNEIKLMINNDYNDINNLNDETVTFYLGMSKLKRELIDG
jgi:hypothetical protein